METKVIQYFNSELNQIQVGCVRQWVIRDYETFIKKNKSGDFVDDQPFSLQGIQLQLQMIPSDTGIPRLFLKNCGPNPVVMSKCVITMMTGASEMENGKHCNSNTV